MQVLGIAWLGVRTENFAAMASLFGKTFGMTELESEPGFIAFKAADGDIVEFFGPDGLENRHFQAAPVVGFRVDDVPAARAELEAKGISFMHQGGDAEGKRMWAHFRAPDGNLYEIVHQK